MTNVAIVLALAIGAGVILGAMALLAPARVKVVMDTTQHRYTALARLYWGAGPSVDLMPLNRTNKRAMKLRERFEQALRTGHALLSWEIFADAFTLIAKIARAHRVRDLEVHVKVGLPDPLETVLLTSVAAGKFLLPATLRDKVSVQARGALGADIDVRADLEASPLTLLLAWRKFRSGSAAQEFARRLKPPPPR